MHILRVDMKNGLHLEFTFNSSKDAGSARDAIGNAGPNEEVNILDDAGHDANILRGELTHYGVVDLAQETESAVLTKLFMENVGKRTVAANPGLVIARPGVLDGSGQPAQPSHPRFAS